MLAMVLHPDVQSRALAEINAVCGDNAPNFDHRSSLPYIDAICREVLRWHPITPLGLPHMTSRDDVYAGYLIPKGPTYFILLSLVYTKPEGHHRVARHGERMVCGLHFNHLELGIYIASRAISRDDRFYPDALKFEPERHLTAEGKLKDEPSFVFGFGR